MPLIKVTTVQGGEVAVRNEDIFYVAENPNTPASDTELFWDAAREVMSSETLAALQAKLGSKFVNFDAASTTVSRYLVNKARVSAVIPHPQQTGVCFLQGLVRKIAVKGSLDEVLAALA